MALGDHHLGVRVVGLERVRVAREHPGADDFAVVERDQIDVLEQARAEERDHRRVVGIVRRDLVPRRHPPFEILESGGRPDLDRHCSGPRNAIVSVLGSKPSLAP
jgi:Lon protease-like protein